MCLISIMKLFFLFLNVLILIAGIALFTPDIISVEESPELSDCRVFAFKRASSISVCTGVSLFVLGCLGIYGVVCRSAAALQQYRDVIICCALTAGMFNNFGYLHKKYLQQKVTERIRYFVEVYPQPITAKIALNLLQYLGDCCGVRRPDDYVASSGWNDSSLPATCCHYSDPCTLTSRDVRSEGCALKLNKHLDAVERAVGSVAVAMATLLVVLLTVTCILLRQSHNVEEEQHSSKSKVGTRKPETTLTEKQTT